MVTKEMVQEVELRQKLVLLTKTMLKNEIPENEIKQYIEIMGYFEPEIVINQAKKELKTKL